MQCCNIKGANSFLFKQTNTIQLEVENSFLYKQINPIQLPRVADKK